MARGDKMIDCEKGDFLGSISEADLRGAYLEIIELGCLAWYLVGELSRLVIWGGVFALGLRCRRRGWCLVFGVVRRILDGLSLWVGARMVRVGDGKHGG